MSENFKINDLFYQQMGSIRNIHFIGIGGVGMCGIAEVLCNLGYNISGSDLSSSQVVEHLISLGVSVMNKHQAENVVHADVVVVSSAINKNNPELIAAKKCHIPIISRAQMLGEIMRFRYGIAVSGTHGKTTTTSLISCILSEAKLDPTYVIGGRLNGGTHARLGQGKYMVVEADESDVSFLHLKPMTAIVTNIDRDHMENYENSFNKLQNSFLHFLELLPFYGLAVLCYEDRTIRKLQSKIPCRTLTYGFSQRADLCAVDCESDGLKNSFTLLRHGQPSLSIELNLPGKHNILNAMAAIGAVSQCGVSDQDIISGLKKFKGVKRRFDIKGKFKINDGEAILLDDYGHHPVEIAANIDAVKSAWPNKRIVMLFQPHRYSRLRALLDDFVNVLSSVDVLLLMDVYSAGEKPIRNINSKMLNKMLLKESNVKTHLVNEKDILDKNVLSYVLPDDILVTQGAGSIGSISSQLTEQLINCA
ncbi:MAG: UDP-N-acetylmuramate--L-alanine ligase [Legionellales bacterium]|nr:UDP-N-acetylmuramate--L-alanine ligase [Legionellales bacterium]